MFFFQLRHSEVKMEKKKLKFVAILNSGSFKKSSTFIVLDLEKPVRPGSDFPCLVLGKVKLSSERRFKEEQRNYF